MKEKVIVFELREKGYFFSFFCCCIFVFFLGCSLNLRCFEFLFVCFLCFFCEICVWIGFLCLLGHLS